MSTVSSMLTTTDRGASAMKVVSLDEELVIFTEKLTYDNAELIILSKTGKIGTIVRGCDAYR